MSVGGARKGIGIGLVSINNDDLAALLYRMKEVCPHGGIRSSWPGGACTYRLIRAS